MKLNHIYITRFIAALSVVIYHYGQEVFPFNKGILGTVFHYGNESVNYFFILSGFIMVIAYYKPMEANKPLDNKKYFVNRFARIYPVYLLSLLLVSGYYLFIEKGLFSNFNVRFPLEVVLVQSWLGKSSLNYPGWSLSVEFFFYLCFPFLLRWLSHKSIRFLLAVLVVMYAANLLLRVNLLQYVSAYPKAVVALNLFPLFHLATFAGGMIAGFIYIRKFRLLAGRQVQVKLTGYGFALLFLLLCIYALDFSANHQNGLLIPAYFFFLLAFSLESRWTKMLANPFFIYLGDISYSLYILQFPVWAFYQYFTAGYIHNKNLSFYLYLLTLVMVSSLTYSFLERRAQGWIKSYYNQRG